MDNGIQGNPPSLIIDNATAGLLPARFRTARYDDDSVTLLSEEAQADETRRLLGKLTPCVGRESELGQLEALLGACLEETTPRALLLLAPAGTGKSRLRREFLRRVAARGEDILVLSGRGDPLGAGTPFSVLRAVVFQLCEVHPRDPVEVRRDKLGRRLGRLLPERDRARSVALLGELCGVPSFESSAPRQNSEWSRTAEEHIRQAFLDWLSAESSAHPIILALEDMHFTDAATVGLVDAALRTLTDRPLFVVGLARPELTESFPRLWHGRVQLMPLRPLSRKSSELLVRQALGMQTPAPVLTRIVERAAGNVLILEELIRAEAEHEGEESPRTVQAMLQARIGRLEPEARRTLRAASLFGDTCWLGGVALLIGMARSECERWLGYLVREELLEERSDSSLPDEVEYRFRQPLMREAAFGLLVDADRTLGQRLVDGFLRRVQERRPFA
jgi:predicted ATPase